MKRIQVINLGCSKNTVDSEHLLAQLPESEFEIVPEEAGDVPVDYLLLNTCGFIGDAKEESIAAVLEAIKRKEEGRAGCVIVFGCLSQRYSLDLPGLIPEVDHWCGARDLNPVLKVLGVKPASKFTTRYTSGHKGYEYLKISEGCDRRCSYCAIPHIRGAHKSVPIEDLVEEASALAARGVKELVLIAQDTTFYGLDLYHRRALAELLQRLSEIPGIEWLRIHYSYPDDFPEDVLEQMAVNPKVCRYLDIPLQHISDAVLSKMRRNVTGQWTRDLISRLREMVPGVALRTTLIVGHPGEGDAEFGELLEFVRTTRFDRMGAFQYSEEEGTYGALHFSDDVPPEEKQRRYDELMTLQSGISLACNQARVGSELKVMVDACMDGTLICRSEFESPEVDGEIHVALPDGVDPESLIGNFIQVKVVAADLYDLEAVII